MIRSRRDTRLFKIEKAYVKDASSMLLLEEHICEFTCELMP